MLAGSRAGAEVCAEPANLLRVYRESFPEPCHLTLRADPGHDRRALLPGWPFAGPLEPGRACALPLGYRPGPMARPPASLGQQPGSLVASLGSSCQLVALAARFVA